MKLALVHVGDAHQDRLDELIGSPRLAVREVMEFCRTCQWGAEFQEAEARNA